MSSRRIAGIDIGTNTILMTVADKSDSGAIEAIADEHAIARLGEALNTTNIINDTALRRAEIILQRYKLLIDSLNVDELRIVATSALRDAENSECVRQVLQKAIDAKVYIISGEKEAYYSYIGTVSDLEASIVIDIGGGSTELIMGKDGEIKDSISMQIGAVRISESFFSSQPASNDEYSQAGDYLSRFIGGINQRFVYSNVYGVGGTFTTLASIAKGVYDFDKNKIHNTILTNEEFEETLELLKKSDLDKIVNEYRVHPKRADVITAGAMIAHQIIDALDCKNCRISTAGLRYGLIVADSFP
jgi:exopolyphosphatase / guanosine-5'-triphosphate,3'-diphosphate pyrophosphatase